MQEYTSKVTALIVVDPFNDFLSEKGKLWPYTKETVTGTNLVATLRHLISSARAKGIRIIYAPHHHTEKNDYQDWKFLAPSHAGNRATLSFEKNSWGAEFHQELQPASGDIIALNHWTASGFANTDLDFILKTRGITHVAIAGMRANTCIDSTARYAVELGYHTTLIKDGIAAFSWEEIDATTRINFPAYGHALLSANEFLAAILIDK